MESTLDVTAVAHRYYDAIMEHDFEAALAVIADDIILREAASLPYGGIHNGREAFMEALGGATKFVDTDNIVLEHMIVDGERVAAFVSFHSPGRPDGEPQHCIDWLVIRGGKIAELMPFYYDTATMLALGE